MDEASAENITKILGAYIGGEQLHIIQDRILLLQTKIKELSTSDTLSVLSQKISVLEKTIATLSTDIQHHIPDFMHEWQQAQQELAQKKKMTMQDRDTLTGDPTHRTQQERMDAIKNFLVAIQWKKVQEAYEQYQLLHTQREKIQHDIRYMQDRQQQLTAWEHKKTELQTRGDLLKKQ